MGAVVVVDGAVRDVVVVAVEEVVDVGVVVDVVVIEPGEVAVVVVEVDVVDVGGTPCRACQIW